MYRKIIWLAMLVTLWTTHSVMAQPKHQVKMETSKGTIIIELDAQAAPKTVANFLTYAENGIYDNTIFHRVIKSFMIQGGGFTKDMHRKPMQPPVVNEADNGLNNATGTIAMARTADPHSATSQFFINVNDNAFLDHREKTVRGWGYCVFGRVIKGMEVVRAIENTETTSKGVYQNVPVKPVVIKRVTLIEQERPNQPPQSGQGKK